MNFMYRTQLNLLKKKGRTLSMILMGILFLIIIFGSAIIKNQAEQLFTKTKQQATQYLVLSSTKTVLPQDKKLVTANLATIKQISKMSGIATYTKSLAISAKITVKQKKQVVSVLGTSNGLQFGEKIPLKTGHLITSKQQAKKVILISDKLANKIKVKVGSWLIFTTKHQQKIKVKVIGIYKDNKQANQMIYTNYPTANLLNDNKQVVTNAIFKTDRLSYRQRQIILTKINKLLGKQKISAKESNVASQLTRLKQLKNSADLVYQIALITMIIMMICGVLIVFWQRRFEIKQLTLLGASRRNIFLQFSSELTIILLLAGYIAFFVVNMLKGSLLTSLNLNSSTVVLNNTFSNVIISRTLMMNMIKISLDKQLIIEDTFINAFKIIGILWFCGISVFKLRFLSYRVKKIF